MPGYLRQATTATVKLGRFVSPTDGVTTFTAGGFTVKAGSNGGALAARHDATAITHDADGYYFVELDATDTAAVGRLKLEVAGSAGNHMGAEDDFTVLSAAVFDWLFGSAAPLAGTAAIATAVWTDPLASSDFSTASSAGSFLKALSSAPQDYGQATAGSTTTLTLPTTEPLAAANLAGWRLVTIGGTGSGQEATIVSSASRVQTFAALATALDATTLYTLLPPATSTTIDKTGYSLAPSGLDAIAVESGVNVRQALAPILAAAGGVVAGAVPSTASTITIKAPNSTTTRISAAVDGQGNRTATTITFPA